MSARMSSPKQSPGAGPDSEVRVEVSAADAGGRIDRVLAERSELSRTRLKGLILDGAVTLGGRTILDPSHRVNVGDLLVVNVPEPEAAEPAGEAIPLNIAFEDSDIIFIDKPAGLLLHPPAHPPPPPPFHA